MVRYSLGENNTYVYPESVKGMVWKSVVYHAAAQVMVGETDTVLKADGKEVVPLTLGEAKQTMKQYQDSQPKPKDLQNLPR